MYNAAEAAIPIRNHGTSSRMILVGVCAWISLCLLIAGWLPVSNSKISSIWLVSGLVGLVSSVGLAETIKNDMRNQDIVLKQYIQASLTDSLTGLANRQALDQILKTTLGETQSGRVPLSMMMMDIDHFKKFNDQWGHQAGDVVLREISNKMQDFFKESGYVARYGGEEFVVVLPNLSLKQAEQLGESFRRQMNQTRCEFRDQVFQVTMSAGVTQARPLESAESLLRRADLALYAAKKMGRDCLWVADPAAGNLSSLDVAAEIIANAVPPQPGSSLPVEGEVVSTVS